MLNIVTSFSPEVLAADMRQKVENAWRDPFVAPVIVFTDSKTQQWFKLRMLEKKDVLMNLRTARLESFLFNALKSDANQYLLSPDILRDVIIQKLLSKQNGISYLEKIRDKDNIANYLNITENIDNINYKHLFDFANDLSNLFTEYEATRENIDTAIRGEDWQKDLYNDIVKDGIVFNDIHYYTCPEIANKNKQDNGGKTVFQLPANQPVFVFGFSGMGQTYRNLLKELGKQADVYVYLQTSPSVDNNIFLKHWAQFGHKNYELFDTDKNTTIIPGTYNENTTLGKIQNAIQQDTELKDKTHFTNDDSLTITGVPSKIKEIEVLHSKICKLLIEKNAALKDILVLAPNIDDYKSEIAAVFNQVDENDPEYPFVPISIVDVNGQNSAVSDVLQILYNVLHEGGFTRKTFFDFTKNFLIQSRYNISDDDISNVFMSWIEDMNVYRIHSNKGTDDWEKAVNRLLIAKLTDKPVVYNQVSTEPFSDFNTEDNGLLAKFVQIFDVVKNDWVKGFKEKTYLTQDDIESLQAFLQDLFAFDEDGGSKFIKENFIYNKINRKLDQYKEFGLPVPTECVLLSLIDIASNVKFNIGSVFTRGITFTSLVPNRILSDKYVFLIGMNSDKFPGVNNIIALDKRLRLPQNGDDDIPEKNKNAFLCQLMATSDELHISFVNKDLQTDEDFYPAYVLELLMQYTNIKQREINIDEDRRWIDLYTPRERRDKQVYLDLNYKNEDVQDSDQNETSNPIRIFPDVVRIKDFENFLENPLKCYAHRMFGFDEEDTSSQELEDIELNNLDAAALKKRLVKPLLRRDKKIEYNDYKDLLPKEPFAQLEFDRVKTDIEQYISFFQSYNKDFGDFDIESNYQINIPLKCEDKKYVLRGEILMCAHTDKDVFLYVPKNNKSDAQKIFPEMYALVAQIAQDPDQEYNAHIIYMTDKQDVSDIKITKRDAERKLNEFYKRAFIDQDIRHIPYFDSGILRIRKGVTIVASFEEYKSKFMDTQYNHYFISHPELLNPDKVLDFSKDDFEQDFMLAHQEHGKLLDPKE